MFMSSLFIWGNISFIGLMNKSVTGLDSPAHMGIIVSAMKVDSHLLLPRHFVIVHFTNFMYAST